MKWIFFLQITWQTLSFGAGLVRENFESVRGAGMGNAYIPMADDSNCLWANPAGLAFVKGFRFNLFDVSLGFDSLNTYNNFSNLIMNGNSTNFISSGQTFIRTGFRPSLFTKYFGLSIYQYGNGVFNLQNLTAANVDIYGVNDIGLIAGFAFPISEIIGFGISARAFQRTGVDAYITPAELLNALGLAALADFNAAIYQYLSSLAGIGVGLGINAGFLARVPLGTKDAPKLRLAATIEDLGDTHFIPVGSVAPATIRANYNFGFGLEYYLRNDFYLNINTEMRHAFENHALLKKMHLGVELKHKKFSLRTGINQGYLTFGASFEALPHTKLHFATYASELGEAALSSSQRWYVFQTIIGFNPF